MRGTVFRRGIGDPQVRSQTVLACDYIVQFRLVRY